jgi:hypothetical protein
MKMKHIYLIVISMAFLAGCRDEQPIKHKIWQMKNDIALIEVESVIEGTDSTGFWEDFKLVPGFTGKKAYRFANSGNEYIDLLAHDAPKTDIPFRLIYRINVDKTEGIDCIAIYPEKKSEAAQRVLDLNTIISHEIGMN